MERENKRRRALPRPRDLRAARWIQRVSERTADVGVWGREGEFLEL